MTKPLNGGVVDIVDRGKGFSSTGQARVRHGVSLVGFEPAF
jgi:hypothetical protein